MTPAAANPGTDIPIVPADEFAVLQRLMLSHTALELDQDRAYLVDARLQPVADRYRLPGVTELIRALGPANHQLVIDTIDALAPRETSFMLTSDVVDSLAEEIIPDLLARRTDGRPLRIWSAACSSGQEPYSLAMILTERYPRLVAAGELEILASDLSPTMVMRCHLARYSAFEINRGLTFGALERHFERDGSDWVVRAPIRALVRTRTVNLIQAWPGVPRCDLVLARNVLHLFPLPIRQQILDRFRRSALVAHGYLILADDEPTLPLRSGFEPLGRGHRSCYRPGGAI